MRVGAGFIGFAIVLAVVPFLGLPAFYETFLYLLLHAVVLATSWNILSGYSGYFSFGHGAFFGAGVYVTAALVAQYNWSFLATLPLAAVSACTPLNDLLTSRATRRGPWETVTAGVGIGASAGRGAARRLSSLPRMPAGMSTITAIRIAPTSARPSTGAWPAVKP